MKPEAAQQDIQAIWEKVQEQLQSVLNEQAYKLWFASVKLLSLSGNVAVVEVPNEFTELWIRENYSDLLGHALASVVGQFCEITYRVSEQAGSHPELIPPHQPRVHRAKPRESNRGFEHENNFNPNYTFETFVVGSNNSMAYAAAVAVAQSPGKSYNPLFLHGGVGLGKTHLLHAIGQYVLQNKPELKVVYLTCEKFTNEFIDGIQNNQLAKFRKKYRQTDVLLIDDVQFLANKERIQEEFFHTFNALHEARKQIVLTCDRPASEIQSLEQRLVSRFEWGLVADLQPPDMEVRLAILRKKAQLMNATNIPEEILQFIASRIRSNIRRLEGALVRVTSYTSLHGKPPTIETVESLLRDLLHEEAKPTVTIELIQKRVAEHFDIRVSDLTGRRRPENIAFPRQIAMYLARRLTGKSLSAIGEAFGGRDHGTVLHACKLVQDRMSVDPKVREIVQYLEAQVLK